MPAQSTNEKETNILGQNLGKRWTTFQTQFPLQKEKHLGNLSCIFACLFISSEYTWKDSLMSHICFI